MLDKIIAFFVVVVVAFIVFQQKTLQLKQVFQKLPPIKSEPITLLRKHRSLNTTEPVELYEKQIQDLKEAKTKYGNVTSMPTLEFNNGEHIPVLAVGTALVNPALIKHVIEAAIDLGYRAIDTAYIYGNEQLIGEAIRAKIDDGTVKRKDLYIMSKLWSTFHKPELVEQACRKSLENLGLNYLDLFMIHNPMSFKEGDDPIPKIANVLQFSSYDYLDAWHAMEGLVKKGLVKSIGVSNFNSEQIARILEKGKIKPVVNQVECHPYLNQLRLNDFCESRDIRLSCFGTLGSKDTPAAYKASDLVALDDPLIQVVAAATGKTPAQLLLRYQLEHGRNAVVKTTKANHLWENLQVIHMKLENEELEAIHAMNRNKRVFTFMGMGDTHKNYPFKLPY